MSSAIDDKTKTNYYKQTNYRDFTVCGYIIHLIYSYPFCLKIEAIQKKLEDEIKEFYRILATKSLTKDHVDDAEKLLKELELKYGYEFLEFYKMRAMISRHRILGK